MEFLLCKIISFIFSLFFYFNMNKSILSIVLLMLSLLFTCLMNIFTHKTSPRANTMLVITSIVIALFYEEFILFMPVIFQDCIFQKRYKFSCIFSILPFSILLKFLSLGNVPFETINISTGSLIILCIGMYLIFGLIGYLTSNLTYVKKELINTADNYDDNIILYRKEKEDLLRQQEYEVHIATLNERNRIAREIHDNVGHMLSRCILQVGALIAINKNDALKDPYLNLKDTLDQAMTNIRNSVHNLHEESMDLETSLQKLFNEFEFCENDFEYDISSNVDIGLRYSLIAITKESLNNVIKHSNATFVSLKLVEHPGFYQYIFKDNGTRLPHKEKGSGMGLYNIEERVHQHNGTFNTSFSDGYCIRIIIPKR